MCLTYKAKHIEYEVPGCPRSGLIAQHEYKHTKLIRACTYSKCMVPQSRQR